MGQTPYQRGQADYYYWRQPRPHKWTTPIGGRDENLTQEERDEYLRGYDDETERKQF